ncbi:MAG: DUF4280 domain-containing protein [Oscillospiraceae bacterium]|nr:DUF4280 domain-containing protein [Oscillospiraceae bacterium]
MPKYVVNGATLKCTLGVSTSKLVVLPVHRVKLTKKLKANIGDGIGTVNILTFGGCTITSPPKPCIPACSKWIGGKTNLHIDSEPALLDCHKITCPAGPGVISITDCGQGSAEKAKLDKPKPQPKMKSKLLKGPGAKTDKETKKLDSVPSVRNGEFEKWFDSLTKDEFETVWANPELKETIKDRLRSPGGYHEWLPVSRAKVFKEWGVSATDIKSLRTPTEDVKFVNPKGRHGGKGSTKAHNEILDIVDTSSNYEEFESRLNDWADSRFEGGSGALPKGFSR